MLYESVFTGSESVNYCCRGGTTIWDLRKNVVEFLAALEVEGVTEFSESWRSDDKEGRKEPLICRTSQWT